LIDKNITGESMKTVFKVLIHFFLFVVFYTIAAFVSASRPFAPITDVMAPDDFFPFLLKKTWLVWIIYIGLAIFIQIIMMKSRKKHEKI